MDKFEEAYESYKQQGTPQANQSDSAAGKEEIIAVRKNEEDNIIAIKTDSGRELDYPTALAEAKAGNLANVDVFHKYGRDILRSEPDGIKENNLDQLPEF
ncbi:MULTISPECIES: DUF3892 domain-containing protein [Bacillaceae]|jgi:hypothetical protein|uniref:DUF3892 domain-containing protein n=1 Tax=Peribacillus frigoritolerans TaxID=450367 RepID=A0AAJ1QJD8_9BACI|nr:MULTISPECIES: DUF3892 domain-containing protein [Bacillaceae]KOR77225.1 hypothetical protein AM232_01100 [Bacillus sp. FJAT-21352]KOR84677.1 hypothetical protein AM233_11650 [Bacillus sp. FJAT-22058]MCD1162642.1 DUF3892 domain-containing protein [Peribacillus castrilensis]MDP9743175.1 hypothetical protein [Bacillus sp. B2I3]QYF82706.1 DUF3892 domain-containing protein [Brevibacterium sp. PAMC21349]